ncbi:hypothetical protein J1N35_009130 [Gossypium stocksii]|uniref:RNase H type-1 domain-containing protein n=1 Tax=Gossypium stocksii TaxID=47602 RepID=A0A9D4AF44_9ROSI|nr:hypothetical protein J1N35_009130 [Gossypium stocksii]
MESSKGLWLAWWNGQGRVIIELDNIDVVNMLTSSAKVGEHNLGWEAHTHMKKEWEVIIQHVYREGNKFADGLALMA